MSRRLLGKTGRGRVGGVSKMKFSKRHTDRIISFVSTQLSYRLYPGVEAVSKRPKAITLHSHRDRHRDETIEWVLLDVDSIVTAHKGICTLHYMHTPLASTTRIGMQVDISSV